jgi:Zn-dependent peptidase ImmA (M78 family)
MQALFAWINEELGADEPALPRFSTRSDPDDAADVARGMLGLSVPEQLELRSASAAWHVWRTAVEQTGVYVVIFSIGQESCRGFSIWHDRAPLIAINSSWIPEARSFTLLHEFAHLLTRTNSACLEVASRPTPQSDVVERWCERFAAFVLIPDAELKGVVESDLGLQTVQDLDAVSRVARRFKTSRRAAALRLIEAGYADWRLYRSIPPVSERPTRGGGGAARTRAEVQADRYGARALRHIADAVRRDVITAGDAYDYLELPGISGGSGDSAEAF